MHSAFKRQGLGDWPAALRSLDSASGFQPLRCYYSSIAMDEATTPVPRAGTPASKPLSRSAAYAMLAALVVIWAALQALGVDVVDWIRTQLLGA